MWTEMIWGWKMSRSLKVYGTVVLRSESVAWLRQQEAQHGAKLHCVLVGAEHVVLLWRAGYYFRPRSRHLLK